MNTYFIFLLLILYSKVYSEELISLAAKLDREDIVKILNDKEVKWRQVLNQSILYSDKYHALQVYIENNDHTTGKIDEFNVLGVLQKFDEDNDWDKKISIDDIRGLIQDATKCAGLTNTNLFAMLILNDFLPFLHVLIDRNKPFTINDFFGLTLDEKDASEEKINEGCDHDPEILSLLPKLDKHKENCETSEAKNMGKNTIIRSKVYDKYHNMNFSIITEQGSIKLNGMGKLLENKLEINSTWKRILRNRTSLDISYRINQMEFNSAFNPRGTVNPVVVNLYEIILVLIFTIQITDAKLEKTCVTHGGCFVKKYKSLTEELGYEFDQFIEDLNENKMTDSKRNLYTNLLAQMADTLNNIVKKCDKLADVFPCTSFFIQQARFEDINTTVCLDITHDKEAEDYR